MKTSNIRSILVVLAAVTLGVAVHVDNASVGPTAMMALTMTIILLIASFVLGAKRTLVSSSVLELALLAGLVLQMTLLGASNFAFESRRLDLVNSYSGVIALIAALSIVVLLTRAGQQRVFFGLLLASFVALAVWILWLGPTPRIDLIVYHKIGVRALSQGMSPYESLYPNIYSPAESLVYYGAGLSKDGMLQVGYPYFPLSLLLALPAELILGDFRIAELLALVIAACLIASARPSPWSMPIALLLLFTPRSFFFLRHGWMEPFIIMLLALSAWCYYRARPWLPVALGLLFASKQYLIIAAPLLLLLIPRPIWSRPSAIFVLKLITAGSAVTLPVILLNPSAFFHSAVWMFLRAPYRADSLSYITWFEIGGQHGFPFFGFAVPLAVLVFCLIRQKQTFTCFLGSYVAVMLPFFALNKQAFANYYHMIIGALCLLAALLAAGEEDDVPWQKPKRAAEPAPLPQQEMELASACAEPSLSA